MQMYSTNTVVRSRCGCVFVQEWMLYVTGPVLSVIICMF